MLDSSTNLDRRAHVWSNRPGAPGSAVLAVVVTKTKIDVTIVWQSGGRTSLTIWQRGSWPNLIRELHAQKLTTPEISKHLAAGKTSTGQVVEMNLDMIRRRLSKINLKAGKYSAHQLQMLQKILSSIERAGHSHPSRTI
jgi:hypothetical protein